MTSPALDATEIRVAGTGGLWKAPLGTTLPVDGATAWGAAFVSLGYTEDGFKVKQDVKKTDIFGWQSLEKLRTVATELVRTFSFTALQSNTATLKLAWGGATLVAGTADAYELVLPDPSAIDEFVLGIDWFDGTTSQRFVLPRCTLQDLPEISYGRKDAVKYPLNVDVLAPADGSKSLRIYGVDPAFAA